MPDEQVNDPATCPNPRCRSKSIDVYDQDGGPPISDTMTLKCNCEDCGWSWIDRYKLEFVTRSDVQEFDA